VECIQPKKVETVNPVTITKKNKTELSSSPRTPNNIFQISLALHANNRDGAARVVRAAKSDASFTLP
jgi:hypothetical protein